MKSRSITLALVGAVLVAGGGWTFLQVSPGEGMTASAESFLERLTPEQREVAVKEFAAPQRLDWHFIPKSERKGLQIKHMTEPQRKAALQLMRSSLSQVGYDKATQIMALEGVLAELEKGRNGGPIRDTERYYFTVFGKPNHKGKWGLSMEGHHLSLNFVVEDDKVISSTPTFFAANPATLMSEGPGIKFKKGLRVLAAEEQLAFDLVQSLSEEQLKVALLDPKAPAEIRAAGQSQPPQTAAAGLAAGDLNAKQKQTLRKLVTTYAKNLPAELSKGRLDEIRQAGPDNIHFAWAGATKPGIGHYYRVQGPTFLIEFVNTQPDAAGNPANHIHCVWRDPRGDFAIRP